MPGTAAPAKGLLLIEQPGGWGRQALTSSGLDPAVGAAVSARAVSAGLRALLIRRPGRRPALTRRAWAVVDARQGREVSRWGTFGDDVELLSVPLSGRAGSPAYEPIYLVCTHGRHDACCAIEGRPVAEAIARLRPDATWECSHVGGDRFAANVVVLPHGITYGRVPVARAGELVTAHDRGELLPDLQRGRCTEVPATQAAVAHVRFTTGAVGIDAVAAAGTLRLGEGRWQVRVRTAAASYVVSLKGDSGPAAGLLTCHARVAARPPSFAVESIRPESLLRATPPGG